MKPRVDVIVPCYNYGDVLEACVNSVLTQHDVDVRVLVMDDASSDTTEAVGSRRRMPGSSTGATPSIADTLPPTTKRWPC